MWNAPQSRAQAVLGSRKRQHLRQKLNIHIFRVEAELKVSSPPKLEATPSEEIIPARIILNDIGKHGMGLFLTQALSTGQTISITLEQPSLFYCKGKVLWCEEFSAYSNIISKCPFLFRAGICFNTETEKERQEIEKYCKMIIEEHIRPIKKAAS